MSRLTRELMAMRAARELEDGMFVNLGVGIPVLVPEFIPEGKQIIFESENGVLGMGKPAEGEAIDPDLVSASATYITTIPGASFFSSATSFGMLRGGHIDVAILGAFQVSEKGDLANWKTPQQKVGSIGGAMDLAAGVKKVIVLMEHVTKSGEPRIVKECTYPLTAKQVVKTIITDLSVIEVSAEGLILSEIADGLTVEELQSLTEPTLIISSQLKTISL